MAKNHRSAWTGSEEKTLEITVLETVANGGTQRDAFKIVAEQIGRTPGACEFHWKQNRKADPDLMALFQDAVAQALMGAVNDPQDDQEDVKDEVIQEITKGATKIHRMIEQIINPGQGIAVPEGVANEIEHILERKSQIYCYNLHWLRSNEYDAIMEYIEESPEHMRNYFQAIENGYDVEMDHSQKIRIIYSTLSKIKPNEPGYMMARGMIVMMWHTIEIMGYDAESVIGLTRSMPF